MNKRLYPPYLNKGSHGLAVRHLQTLLCALGFFPETPTLDGRQEGATTEAIKCLQRRLGFTGEDVDGNFGPGTRSAFFASYKLDVYAIPLPPKERRRTYWYCPNRRGKQKWPTKATPEERPIREIIGKNGPEFI